MGLFDRKQSDGLNAVDMIGRTVLWGLVLWSALGLTTIIWKIAIYWR